MVQSVGLSVEEDIEEVWVEMNSKFVELDIKFVIVYVQLSY